MEPRICIPANIPCTQPRRFSCRFSLVVPGLVKFCSKYGADLKILRCSRHGHTPALPALSGDPWQTLGLKAPCEGHVLPDRHPSTRQVLSPPPLSCSRKHLPLHCPGDVRAYPSQKPHVSSSCKAPPPSLCPQPQPRRQGVSIR